MKRTLFLLTFAIALLSCGNNSSGTDRADSTDTPVIPVNLTPTVTPTVAGPAPDPSAPDVTRDAKDGQVVPQTDSIVRFMVSFISKGFGIDHDSKKIFDTWLKGRADIKYTASPWGKEGEWSYCFPLKNKSAAEQEQFMRDVKNLLTKRDLIVFSENIPCERRR